MFGIGAMALYSGNHDAVPTQAPRKDPKLTKAPRPPASSSQPNPPSDLSSMEQLSSASIADFLGPAVDSPPSPQKLRQLNKQMKRASHLQRHHGHKTASSESSSLSSMNTTERLPWELALDNLSLVRRSSIRSNDSSAPSRDRPESIHNFGKGFFHRRGKSKRESSAHSSSASSMYSGEMSSENNTSGGKEGIIPSLFSRRKPSRDEPTLKRPQISGPFNFQHVTHTQRDNANESSVSGPDTISETPSREFDAHQYRLPYNVSSESMGDLCEDQMSGQPLRPALAPRHTAPTGPRRLLKHIRSQEHLRKSSSQPPPRPPRSPVQANGFSSTGPLPPPRVSSRQSSYQDVTDAINVNAAARAQTSGEFRQPLPFSPATSSENIVDDFSPYDRNLSIQPQEQPSPDEKRYSRVMLGARDSTWPLAIATPVSYETLPDVPEEDEHHGLSRRSRLSLASNNSSLRGSQSVPMLRSLAESQRPTSGASETLGGLGIMGLNRIVQDGPQSPAHSGTPTRESWEDLIDYCYDHEAEADCDYQWERPSLDTARDSITPPANVAAVDGNGLELRSNAIVLAKGQHSPSPAGLDAPSLSPASHRSTPVEHEVVTPNFNVTNNFSLPRGDRKSIRPLNMKDTKRSSGLSTFRESQAFTLSPSLLIPGDYQQQMLLGETDKNTYSDYEFIAGNCHQSAFHDDATPLVGTSKLSPLVGHRSSTSTTETNSTSRSNSTGRQYRSTNSSWTTLARRTASTTSLNKMAGALTDESEPLPTAQPAELEQDGLDWSDPQAVAQDHVPDMIPFPPTSGLKRYHHKSHASESQVRDDVPPASPMESARPRRPRARTTSLSAQSPPPVGQYALFPRTHVKAIGDHI